MKGVLIGADLMYRQDGKLVPIEINTNTGWDVTNRIEREEDVFDLSDLLTYALEHNITDIYIEGQLKRIIRFWPQDAGVAMHGVTLTEFNELEDSDTKLCLRTSYSDEAYIDNFCRDKVNFLRAIQNRDYGHEYILRTADGLFGEISSIKDNGDFPNFIVKYRYPNYNKFEYPKVLRFTSLEQLHDWVDENLEEDCLIEPFFYSEDNLYENSRIKLIRNWTVWVANEVGTLDSIYVGQYTKLSGDFSNEVFEWNEDGSPVNESKVHKLLSTALWFTGSDLDLLVEADDVILMKDGSWKTAEDLQEGDEVKAVYIPTNGDVDIHTNVEDYNVPFSQLEEESEFVINTVKLKRAVDGWIDETVMNFTDGTNWFDSDESAYPVLDPIDQTVMFKKVGSFQVGDQVILMPATSEHLEKPEFVLREIESLEKRRVLQKGYSINISGNHLFLSRTSADANAYISIEHNPPGKGALCIAFFGCGVASSNCTALTATMFYGTKDACFSDECQCELPEGIIPANSRTGYAPADCREQVFAASISGNCQK